MADVPEILLEDGPLLAVNKPAGLLTQGPPGVDSIVARIRAFLKWRDAKPGKAYLGVPHRLDRPVSGAMVFAKHVRAARRIAEQFEARSVKKIYWACAAGRVEPASGTWRDLIRKIPDQAQAAIADAEHPDGREAVLHYRTLAHCDWGSWLELALETGRMHQIRVQAASRGHAILGDTLYGSPVPFGENHEDERARTIALHARSLILRHPMTQNDIALLAPLPSAWRQLDPRFKPYCALVAP